jgi:hypothetical protein
MLPPNRQGPREDYFKDSFSVPNLEDWKT